MRETSMAAIIVFWVKYIVQWKISLCAALIFIIYQAFISSISYYFVYYYMALLFGFLGQDAFLLLPPVSFLAL
jgi:hypothetical protein